MTTRLLLTAAAIAVGGGLLGVPNAYLFGVLNVVAPWGLGAAAGLYVLPGLVAQAALRRPGAGLLTQLLAGLVAAPFVPTGIVSVVSYLLLGVLIELPFLLTLYRRWTAPMFWITGVWVAAFYSVYWALAFDTAVLGPLGRIGQPVILVAAMLVVVAITIAVARALRERGVLRGLDAPPNPAEAR